MYSYSQFIWTRISIFKISTFPIGILDILKIENRVQINWLYGYKSHRFSLKSNSDKRFVFIQQCFEHDFDLQNIKHSNWNTWYFEDRKSCSKHYYMNTNRLYLLFLNGERCDLYSYSNVLNVISIFKYHCLLYTSPSPRD